MSSTWCCVKFWIHSHCQINGIRKHHEWSAVQLRVFELGWKSFRLPAIVWTAYCRCNCIEMRTQNEAVRSMFDVRVTTNDKCETIFEEVGEQLCLTNGKQNRPSSAYTDAYKHRKIHTKDPLDLPEICIEHFFCNRSVSLYELDFKV